MPKFFGFLPYKKNRKEDEILFIKAWFQLNAEPVLKENLMKQQ